MVDEFQNSFCWHDWNLKCLMFISAICDEWGIISNLSQFCVKSNREIIRDK